MRPRRQPPHKKRPPGARVPVSPPKHDEATLERLGREGRAYLKAVRQGGRELALRTRPQDHAAECEWLASYGQAAKLYLGDLTDTEALTIVGRDRTLLPFLLPRLEKKLQQAARTAEPSELETVRGFFEGLGQAILPRTRGQRTDWDGEQILRLYTERHGLNTRTLAAYRVSGKLPTAQDLPVLELKDGERLTIDDDPGWPSAAAWVWVGNLLGESPDTLKGVVKRMRRTRGQ